MAVTQHHQINLTTGILQEIAWGNHALQTITIARNTPRNPQQAVGYKGIIDYTSAAATSDITLDCIFVEPSGSGTSQYGTVASAGANVYAFAAITSGYVLTSCNIGFTAGNPATVSFGYQCPGSAAAITGGAAPSVSAGDVYAVILGDDGNGLAITPSGQTVPSGVQSINFASTINREQILDVRSVTPIEFVTTYPIDVSMDLETLATFTLGASPANNLTITDAAGANIYVYIEGLQLVTQGESINVGGYLTKTYNYIGSDLWLPRAAP